MKTTQMLQRIRRFDPDTAATRTTPRAVTTMATNPTLGELLAVQAALEVWWVWGR